MIVPNSWGSPLREFNSCHSPEDGKFCSGDGIKVWRGVRGTGFDAREPRPGYIATYSSSKAMADTYAGDEGRVEPFTLRHKTVIEFPVTKDRDGHTVFDKFEFDRRARQLADDEVLVARQVLDTGPWASLTRDPARLWSYPADVYATNTGRMVEPGHGVTAPTVAAFADEVKTREKLDIFDLRLKNRTIFLETMAAKRGQQGKGAGTRAMEQLTTFADTHGLEIELSLGEKGFQPVEGGVKTSSPARLAKFYQRFGFVRNKGRHKRFELSIYTSMYRRPKGTP